MTLRSWLIDLFYDHHWHLDSEQVVDGKLVMEFRNSEKSIKVAFVEEKENEQ